MANREGAWEGLVTRCFHVLSKDNKPQEQGIVRAHVKDDVYLVQYFNWSKGQPTTCRLATLAEMMDWQFYEDNEHMQNYYRDFYAGQTGPLLHCETLEGQHVSFSVEE